MAVFTLHQLSQSLHLLISTCPTWERWGVAYFHFTINIHQHTPTMQAQDWTKQKSG